MNEIRAIYGARCRFVNDWFQSHFSSWNRHFLEIKTGEHTYFTSSISSSICWLFHYFSKAVSTWRFHSRAFLQRFQHCLQCWNRCITYKRICLSLHLSTVTFRGFVETNEATIMRFSLSGSTIILVSGELKIVRKFAGITPSEGVKVRPSTSTSENLTNNEL